MSVSDIIVCLVTKEEYNSLQSVECACVASRRLNDKKSTKSQTGQTNKQTKLQNSS